MTPLPINMANQDMSLYSGTSSGFPNFRWEYLLKIFYVTLYFSAINSMFGDIFYESSFFDLKIRCYLKYMKRANNPNRLKDPTYNQVNQSVKVDLQISKGIFSFRTIHRITMDHIKARETKVTIGLNLISPKYGTRNLTHKLLS